MNASAAPPRYPSSLPLDEKEPVEKDLEDKDGKKNSDLEGQIAARCPVRGALELMAPLKFVALHLQFTQMPAQPVQLVPALRRFGAELAHRRRRRLPNGAEPPFEVETRQALLVGAKLVEKHAMSGVLLGFGAFNDPVFDIIEGDAIRSRLLAGASLGAGCSKRHIAREPVDAERREHFKRRTIVMLLAFEAVQEARERRSWCRHICHFWVRALTYASDLRLRPAPRWRAAILAILRQPVFD